MDYWITYWRGQVCQKANTVATDWGMWFPKVSLCYILFLVWFQVLTFMGWMCWSPRAQWVCVYWCVWPWFNSLLDLLNLASGWRECRMGGCIALLPEPSSWLEKGPLPSLKLCPTTANNAPRWAVVITQSSRRIVLLGFPPIFLLHSSWQYSLQAVFPINMVMCILLECARGEKFQMLCADADPSSCCRTSEWFLPLGDGRGSRRRGLEAEVLDGSA